MIYPIYLYGHPVLRKRAEEIDADYKGLQDLIVSMKETMYKAEGIGLAAPQIGKSIRLIVIDASPLEEDEPSCKDLELVLINPEIISFGEESVFMEEGCLSVPGIRGEVKRPTRIRLRYMDENMKEHEQDFEGFAARVIQHEYDHIEGKVFVDSLSPVRRSLLRSKLQAMTKGKVSAKYKTKSAK